jgi:hypothetical protein
MDVDYRLWDGQWVNIVNAPTVLSAFGREEAVAIAVRLCEEAMAINIADDHFPPKRKAAQRSSDER